jgi:hypothetical protein
MKRTHLKEGRIWNLACFPSMQRTVVQFSLLAGLLR